MQTTLTRPNAFFSYTGVPLGPFPMNAPDPEDLAPYVGSRDGNGPTAECLIDVIEIVAPRCAL
jgi:hypothetical protein